MNPDVFNLPYPKGNNPSNFQLTEVCRFGGVREQTNNQSNIETDSLTDWCFYREINISKSKALDAMDCNEDDSGEQESDDIDRSDTPNSHSLLDDTDESKPENLSVNNEDIAAALIRYT